VAGAKEMGRGELRDDTAEGGEAGSAVWAQAIEPKKSWAANPAPPMPAIQFDGSA